MGRQNPQTVSHNKLIHKIKHNHKTIKTQAKVQTQVSKTIRHPIALYKDMANKEMRIMRKDRAIATDNTIAGVRLLQTIVNPIKNKKRIRFYHF